MTVRVLIADDHVLWRRGLQAVVGLDPRVDIVGEAANGQEAVAGAVDLVPDVALLDVRMPGLDGTAACAQIRRMVPSTRIIMLTSSDEESDLFEAVKAGASGYLLKDVLPEEVADAIVAVHAGQSLVPPGLAAKLLAEFAELSRREELSGSPRANLLTERERQVLRLVSLGRKNREIAVELFISENTVKNHVRNILEKLQLHSRVEAAMYAVKAKIFDQI